MSTAVININTTLVSDLKTLPEVARDLGERLHRVRYAAREHHVEPVGRVGIAYVYDPPGVDRIKSALRRIGGRR